MAWVEYDRTSGKNTDRHRGQLHARISPSWTAIQISIALRDLIGDASHVRLLLNAEASQFALVPSESSANALKLTRNRSAFHMGGAGAVLRALHLLAPVSFDGAAEGDLIVFTAITGEVAR